MNPSARVENSAISQLNTSHSYKVLEVLAENQGVCSQADLRETIRGSEADLEGAIQAIRRLGYPIHIDGARSVQLRAAVDVVNRRRFHEGLSTEALGHHFACHLEVGSTNDLAMEAGLGGAPHGSLILAEHQTAGRGRCGRDWYSPVAVGLWFSILLRPSLSADGAWMLTLGAGVAVAEAVEAMTGLHPDLMWPNDVLLEGRKLAGILTETRLDGPDVSFAVVGIGINVAQDVTDFPLDLRGSATSLNIVFGHPPERTVLLSRILERLESITRSMTPERIRALWKARSAILGRRISARSADGQVEGIAEDLTPGGALSVRVDEGGLASVQFGEVDEIRESNERGDDASSS